MRHMMNGDLENDMHDDEGLSPLTIDIMLACYVSPDPVTQLGTTWVSPAGIQVRKWLRGNDLIDDRERATERGKAWVRFICATPLPVASWALPERAPTVPSER